MNSYMKDLFLYEEFPGIEIYKTFFDVATVSEVGWMGGLDGVGGGR